MISLDHPCEIENGVLKYTFLSLRNNAGCCCISSHEDILLLQGTIAHLMLFCVGGHNHIFLFMWAIFMVHMSVSQHWVTQQLNYWCSGSYFVIFCMLRVLTLAINTQLSGYELHPRHIISLHSISLNVKLILCKKLRSIFEFINVKQKVMAYLTQLPFLQYEEHQNKIMWRYCDKLWAGARHTWTGGGFAPQYLCHVASAVNRIL